MTLFKSIYSTVLPFAFALFISNSVFASALPDAQASYSMNVGKFKVVALYDGYLPADMVKILEGGEGARISTLLDRQGWIKRRACPSMFIWSTQGTSKSW